MKKIKINKKGKSLWFFSILFIVAIMISFLLGFAQAKYLLSQQTNQVSDERNTGPTQTQETAATGEEDIVSDILIEEETIIDSNQKLTLTGKIDRLSGNSLTLDIVDPTTTPMKKTGETESVKVTEDTRIIKITLKNPNDINKLTTDNSQGTSDIPINEDELSISDLETNSFIIVTVEIIDNEKFAKSITLPPKS